MAITRHFVFSQFLLEDATVHPIELYVTALHRSALTPMPLSREARGASSETGLSSGFVILSRKAISNRLFCFRIWPRLLIDCESLRQAAYLPLLPGILQILEHGLDQEHGDASHEGKHRRIGHTHCLPK